MKNSIRSRLIAAFLTAVVFIFCTAVTAFAADGGSGSPEGAVRAGGIIVAIAAAAGAWLAINRKQK
ncbi:MAG: hypothetical protein SOV71_05895 [Anaerovoracaceae bacterium]|nr:hypothetical protein [Bacillota bacterium]MDY2671069.1 hypothetical protein [Anaerovoracaceae bacterium]